METDQWKKIIIVPKVLPSVRHVSKLLTKSPGEAGTCHTQVAARRTIRPARTLLQPDALLQAGQHPARILARLARLGAFFALRASWSVVSTHSQHSDGRRDL